MEFITQTLDESSGTLLWRAGLQGGVDLILDYAFKAGGYVAGGFATLFARVKGLGIESKFGLSGEIRTHLGSPRWPATHPQGGCGDIDVWFPDQASLDRFLYDHRVSEVLAATGGGSSVTSSGAAHELVVPGRARIQVITKYLAPIEEQLSRFDIYNGAVAFTDDKIFIPEHWEYLERNRMIHVMTWASPWTPNRLLKWCRKSHYEQVSPSTATHVVEQLFKALEWADKWNVVIDDAPESIKKDKIIEEIRKDRLKTSVILNKTYRLQKMLEKVIPAMTNEQLLQISALFKEPATYDLAMREINKRAWVPE